MKMDRSSGDQANPYDMNPPSDFYHHAASGPLDRFLSATPSAKARRGYWRSAPSRSTFLPILCSKDRHWS